MKKLRSILLIISVLFIGLVTGVNASGVAATYDAGTSGIIVKGTINGCVEEGVTIMILPYGTNPASVSDGSLPSALKVTDTDTNGNFSAVILPGSGTPGGKYVCYVYAEGGSASSEFMYLNAGAAGPPLGVLNGAADAAEMNALLSDAGFAASLGVDIDEFSRNAQGICKILSDVRPAGGFADPFSFYAAYLSAEAGARLNAGDNLKTVVEKYGEALGVNYENDVAALTGAQQDMLGTLLQGVNFSDKRFSEAFYACRFLACFVTADRYSALRSVVEAYGGEFGFAVSAGSVYGGLTNKDGVFIYMLENGAKNARSVSAALTLFNAALDKAGKTVGSIPSGGDGGRGDAGTQSGKAGGALPPVTVTEDYLERESVFGDIYYHWAKETVLGLWSKGIVSGFPDGTFRPDASINRAEFTKIIVGLMELTPLHEGGFEDVTPEDWHYPYVAAAHASGIVNGDGQYFHPDRAISREDAVTILYRALRDRLEDGEYMFEDSPEVAGYAAKAVSVMGASGLIRGDGRTFMPKREMTRAEAATLISKLLGYIANVGGSL